jgi:hypothetical protein
MAFTGYAAKYTLTFSDVYQNTTGQYIATIYKKEYSGSVIEVSGTGTPLVIETDSSGGNGGYRPVIATKATLNLLLDNLADNVNWNPNTNTWNGYNKIYSQDRFDIREFITSDPDTFLLEIKRKGGGGTYQIIWQGYYIYNTDVALNEIAPLTFSLQFSDFGLMKVNRFYNFPASDTELIHYFPKDELSLLDVIMRCCYFAYITDTVSLEYPFPYSLTNSYLDGNGDTQNVTLNLTSMYIQKNAFLQELGKYKTLFEVLEGVCSQFGLIAFFKNNKLHIKSYDALVNNTTGSVSTAEYTVSSYDVTSDTVIYSFYDYGSDSDSIIALNSGNFKNIGRDQTIRFNYPVENITLSNSASLNYNTPNYTMGSLSQVNTGGASTYYAINNWFNPDGGECVFDFYDQVSASAGSCVALPFYPFTKIKTDTYGTNFATQFKTKYVASSDPSRYIDSQEISVSPNDIFTFSYSAYTDGRLKNLPVSGGAMNQGNMRPRPFLSLVLLADDGNGNETTYYYNYTTNKFITTLTELPLITTTNVDGTDSDWIHYDLKAELIIPNSAKLKIRQYQPFRGVTSSLNDDRYELYVEYCNLQAFKGSTVSGLPTSQLYKVKYSDLINSDESSELKSNIFIQDAQKYVPTGLLAATEVKAKNPIFVASCYGNHIFDKYNYPASGISLSYANPSCINVSYSSLQTKLKDITTLFLKNIGLSNVTIEGTYKSDAVYFIGNKFSYQITGYNSVNFSMLDYSIDLKNATYNALLYSSKFIDSTGKTVVNQTVIS